SAPRYQNGALSAKRCPRPARPPELVFCRIGSIWPRYAAAATVRDATLRGLGRGVATEKTADDATALPDCIVPMQHNRSSASACVKDGRRRRPMPPPQGGR